MTTSAYRKAGTAGRTVRELSFDRLPPAARERVVRSLAQGGAPIPLISSVKGRRPPSPRRWVFVALAAAFLDAIVWFDGFGDPLMNPRLAPHVAAAAHAVAIGIALFAVLYAIHAKRRYAGVPYPDGRHLFDLDLVEIEGRLLRVTSLDDLKRIEARPGSKKPAIALVFGGGHEVIFDDQDDVEMLALRSQEAVERTSKLVLPQDHARIERVDLFVDLRIADDWADASAGEGGGKRSLLERLSPAALAGASLAAAALAGAGTLVAGQRHLVALDEARFEAACDARDSRALEAYSTGSGPRAAKADDLLFEIAKMEKGSELALARYVRRGGAHAAEAEDLLFVMRKGDPDDLVDYIKKGGPLAERADDELFEMARRSGRANSYAFYMRHGKRHLDEAARLRPAAAIADAKKDAVAKNSVVPLLDFLRESSSAPAGEVKDMARSFYQGALQHYVETRNPDRRRRAFAKALLDRLLEQNDPRVFLAVAVEDVRSLVTVDSALSAQYGADYLPASPHFTDAFGDLLGFRQAVAQRIGELLTSLFPGGVVRTATIETASPDGPMISVQLKPVANSAFRGQVSNAVFAGVRFEVRFLATIPGRSEQLSWTETTAVVPDFTVDDVPQVDGAPDRAALARKAYGRMLDGAQDTIAAQIQNRL